MKFIVETVWEFGKDVLKQYPQLNDYNVVIKNKECVIELNNLDDLLKLQEDTDFPLIINKNNSNSTIEIYDGYRE